MEDLGILNGDQWGVQVKPIKVQPKMHCLYIIPISVQQTNKPVLGWIDSQSLMKDTLFWLNI